MEPTLLLSPAHNSNPPNVHSSFLGGPVLSPVKAKSPSCVSLACVYAPVSPRHRWVVVVLGLDGKYEAWRVHEGASASVSPAPAKPPAPPMMVTNAWDDDEGGWGDDGDDDDDGYGNEDVGAEQNIEALLRAAEETGRDGSGGPPGGIEKAPKPMPNPMQGDFSAAGFFVSTASDLPYVNLTHYPPPASAPIPSVSASAQRYLSSLDPSTDPDVDEAELALIKASLESSGPGGGGGCGGDDDDDADSDDDSDPLSAFSSALSSDPTQVIRYGYDSKPLYSVSERAFKPPSPKDCAACGGKRRFEFQVLPRCIYLLGLDGVEAKLPNLPSDTAGDEGGVVVGEGDGLDGEDGGGKRDKNEGDKVKGGGSGANNKPGGVRLIDLEKDEKCFGNLMVYCCENSCGGEGVVMREEIVFQPPPEFG